MALYISKIKFISNYLKNHINQTSLQFNNRLSIKHKCNVYLKREDQQITRSYKLRGCINKILNNMEKKKIICASAGNHAQGISYLSNKYNLNSTIFLPTNTPNQKIKMIHYYGKENINLRFIDGVFDNSLNAALEYFSKNTDEHFIHPYNDYDIIDGNATISHEIYNKLTPDYIMCPVGGGGLISGVSKYSKYIWEPCKIIGVEPIGAASFKIALENNKPVKLLDMDKFVDGAAVAQIGDKTFEIIRDNIDENLLVNNSEVAKAIIDMYEYDGIILEPAGALSIAGLSKYTFNSNDIVVCILSGSNNDLSRYSKYLDLIR